MLSAIILSERSYPAVLLAEQPVHQRFVLSGPLVLGKTSLKQQRLQQIGDQPVSRMLSLITKCIGLYLYPFLKDNRRLVSTGAHEFFRREERISIEGIKTIPSHSAFKMDDAGSLTANSQVHLSLSSKKFTSFPRYCLCYCLCFFTIRFYRNSRFLTYNFSYAPPCI
jgi:hypothetical protein